MKSKLTLSCVLCLAAILGYWLLKSQVDQPPAPQTGEASQAQTKAAEPAPTQTQPQQSGELPRVREQLPQPQPPLTDPEAADPCLVSGSVTDETGKPVEGAELLFRRESIDAQGVSKWVRFRLQGDAKPTSGSDGKFTIRQAQISPGRYRLQLLHEWYLSVKPVTFTAGTTDLHVVMPAAGQVHATVLLPDGVHNNEIQGLLVDQSGSPLSETTHRTSSWVRVPDGSLKFLRVPPGQYRLSLPYTQITDILVRPGQVTVDSRLHPVDLRETLEVVHLTVVDTSGNPLPEAEVMLRVGRSGRGRNTDGQGRYQATLARKDRAQASLTVSRSGFSPQTITDIEPEMRAVLEPRPSVRVRIPFPGATATGSHTLHVDLYRREQLADRNHTIESERIEVREGHDSVVPLPGPGTYTVRWKLELHNPDGQTRIRYLHSKPVQTVEVNAHTREMVVVADLTAADIQRALQELRAQ